MGDPKTFGPEDPEGLGKEARERARIKADWGAQRLDLSAAPLPPRAVGAPAPAPDVVPPTGVGDSGAGANAALYNRVFGQDEEESVADPEARYASLGATRQSAPAGPNGSAVEQLAGGQAPPRAPAAPQGYYAPGKLVPEREQRTGYTTQETEGLRIAPETMEQQQRANELDRIAFVQHQAAANVRAQAEQQAAADAHRAAQAHLEQTAKQYADAQRAEYQQIDPNHLWKERGIGAQIGAAFAIGLGSMGAALTGGPNTAMQIVDKALDRDLESQAKNIANSRMSREEQAVRLSALRESQLSAIKAKLEDYSGAAKRPEQQAAAAQMMAQIERQQADQAIRTQQLAQGHVVKSTQTAVIPEHREGAGWVGPAPGAAAGGEVDLAKLDPKTREQMIKLERADANLAEIERIKEKAGYGTMSEQDKQRIRTLATQNTVIVPQALGLSSRERIALKDDLEGMTGAKEADFGSRVWGKFTGKGSITSARTALAQQKADVLRGAGKPGAASGGGIRRGRRPGQDEADKDEE